MLPQTAGVCRLAQTWTDYKFSKECGVCFFLFMFFIFLFLQHLLCLLAVESHSCGYLSLKFNHF